MNHSHLQKVRILDGVKLLRKQFYAGSYQLISCDATAEDSTSFKRGRKNSVSSRTEQSFKQGRVDAPERDLQGLSLQKVGIWEKHWQDKMESTGSTCWTCWGSWCCVGVLGPVFMVSPPFDALHHLWKIIAVSIPKFPGYIKRINNIPVTLYGIQPQSHWIPPGWSQVHVITDIKSVTLNYCRFLLPDHLDHEIDL